MRFLKAGGALLLLAALLFGVPWALLAWGHPLELLSVDWSTALLRPDDGRITLGVLSLVGWLAWFVLAATTVGELLNTLSKGAIEVRLPGTGWLRPAVASLVGAVLAPIISTGLGQSVQLPTPPLASAVAPLDSSEPAADPPGAPIPEAQTGDAYVVAPGDELWSLAERFLGSGEKWREIVAVNPGMSHSDRLTPGDLITLPPGAQASASAGVGDDRAVTVAEGDTLWDLAEEHLGDATRWPELHHANRGTIADPDEIEVGWQLYLPASEPHHGIERETEEAHPTAQSADPPVVLESLPGDAVASPTLPAAPPPGSLPPPDVETPSDRPPREEVVEQEDLLGPVGAVLAAGIFAGVAARRRTQLLQRAVGRRLLPVRPELQHFWSSLTRRGADAAPPEKLGPTGVVLGWSGDKEVAADLESNRCTLVQSPAEDAVAVISAMLTSLLCAPWSTSVDVVAVASPDEWQSSLDDPRISGIDQVADGLVELQRLCAQRRIQLGAAQLADVREQADLASAWVPVVFMFSTPLARQELDRVQDCLSLGRVGVSVVAAVTGETPLAPGWELVRVESADRAVRVPGGSDFVPQLLSGPARRAVVELFAAASSAETEPAPWWDEDPLPPNVKVLPRKTIEPTKDSAMSARSATPEHPTLLLLGPVELRGCTGTVPNRSVASCIESCAWLLANPGGTPTKMAKDLLIAETTRRSNVSRLRSWLGGDASGEPYLPDGYSGRLELHPEVSSDWEGFQLLLSGGVNHAGSGVLREALQLVRGEPLEGVAFQWPWAEQLRVDMVSMITDAAAVFADRALEQRDLEAARWAVDRGRLAVGEDETLTVREIHLAALGGDRKQMDQLIRQVTRSARAAGRDLRDDSVQRIRQALNLAVAGQHAN